MCKTIKTKLDDKLSFETLLNAHNRARIGKCNKSEVLKFEQDLETNLCNLLYKLKNGIYKPGNYKTFEIYEPKMRIIKALPYIDRVVQQWYIYEFIKPYIVPRFINDNCACIDNKGTLYAVNKVQKYMKCMKRKYNDYYVLKLDIKKYFYNIDKNILYNIMKSYIKDEKLLKLTSIFIFDDEEQGIPIGNYTSQYFANIYLNELDHFIKERLLVKYYVRYMDDLVLLLKDKNECKFVLKKIKNFINKKLKLQLNNKSRYYPNKMGINFCGYRIFEEYKLLRNRSKRNIKNKIKLWNYLNKNNILNNKRMLIEWNSFISYAKHSNSYRFITKMINNIDNNIFIREVVMILQELKCINEQVNIDEYIEFREKI